MTAQARRDRSASDRTGRRRSGRAHLNGHLTPLGRLHSLAKARPEKHSAVRQGYHGSSVVRKGHGPARAFVKHSTRRSSPAVAMSLIPHQRAELYDAASVSSSHARVHRSSCVRAVHIARCYAVRHRQHFERAQHVTRNATRRWRRPDRHPRCSLPKATRRWPGHEKVATACTETGLRPQALPQGWILSVLSEKSSSHRRTALRA